MKDSLKIGEDILIHNHISDPESWFLTIKNLNISAQRLCGKSCNHTEIARYVNVELSKKLNIVEKLISEVIPYT